MKRLIPALALGFALTASPHVAQARVCAKGAHHAHCFAHHRSAYLHHWHHGHHWRHYPHYAVNGYPAGGYGYYPAGGPGYYPAYGPGHYPPYPYAYPSPLPEFWVDDPSHPFRTPQQWLMDQEGDVPFTSYRVRPAVPWW